MGRKIPDSLGKRNGVFTPYPSIDPQRNVHQVGTNHRNRTMTTIIEKDSPIVPLLILAIVFLFFLAGGLGLAYVGGVFTGKNQVIENDKRIANQASLITPAR
jgi:hypothetical protein